MAPESRPTDVPTGPGRAEAPDATAWLPLPELDDLPPIHELLEPGTESPPRHIPVQPSPARAEAPDATAWLPLPNAAELPEVAPTPAPSTAPARRAHGLHLPSGHLFKRLGLSALAAATVVAGYFAVSALLDGGADVTLRADGKVREVETDASTVASLLREEKVAVGPYDRVTPGRRAEITDGMTISVVRAVPYAVDFDGEQRTLYSTSTTPSEFVDDVASQVGVPSNRLALRDPPDAIKASEITPEAPLVLRTKKRGTLLVDGSAVNYDSPSHTVAELLEDYKVVLQPSDFTSLGGDGGPIGLDDELPHDASIEVVRVTVPTVQELQPYDLPDERLPDPELEVGHTRIQERVTGTLLVTYAVEMHDGREVGRTQISAVPVKPAQPYIEFYGAKYNPLWDKMAQCETGGNWSAPGPEYQGGLGIYWRNWVAFGGREFAPTAGQATKVEQIIVAERIRAKHGWHAWGCAKTIGL